MKSATGFSRKARALWSCKAVLLLIPLGSIVAVAQLPTATILGVVKDSSGAVVPEATLTARNIETGQSRSVISSQDGSYRFSALPVGHYEVRVEHAGFQTEVGSGLSLTVSQEAVVNFTLQIGQIEQTVAVTADAPLVNTTSGSLGGLVDEGKVADLPLNGRNFVDLTLLQTGVIQQPNRTYTGAMTGTWMSSNGAPIRSNNYLLDGAIMQSLQGATPASVSGSTLGLEGIREYRVVTNSFTAEYGMTMGSQMMIVSKSGNNSFHGSLFEYLRNSALDARNFFDKKTPTTPRRLPAYTRNNFGGAFGGPIKKDKTFFYGVYEALRDRTGVTTVSNTIPVSAKVDGGLVPQIAPVIKPLLALYPAPNLPNNQFTFPFSQPTNEHFGQIRVDQTFSANDTLFARYTLDDTTLIQGLPFPQFQSDKFSRNQYATLSETHVFSGTLLNTGRFSFSRTFITNTSPSSVIGPQYSFVPGLPMGSIAIGGVTTLGPNTIAPQRNDQNIFTWSDDLFYTKGRHSIKFGALINRYQIYIENGANTTGAVTFGSLQSFLLGQPTTYTSITPGSIVSRTYHYSTIGFYAQDDLRVTPRLTLNVGFRYEFLTQPQEVQGLGAALRNVLTDANLTKGPPFKNPSLENFSPRFGFAWDVKGDGRTAVRGGFGLLYDIGDVGAPLIIGAGTTVPFSSQSTVSNPTSFTIPFAYPPGVVGKTLRLLDYNLSQPHMLQYNLTVERQLPFSMALTVAYAGSRGLNLLMVNEGNPTVPQVLPNGQLFWTGTEPRVNRNWASIELHASAGNSWYNALQVGLTKRLSKGLQLQSSYTYSKTIDQNQAGLTTENNSTSSAFPVDPFNISVDKSRSNFDFTQNWRTNLIYHFPDLASSGGVQGALVNGWGANTILSLQSGQPFTPAMTSNRSRSLVGGGAANIDRPDLLPGRNGGNIVSGTTAGCLGVAPGRALGTPTLYYDPCAFTVQAIGFLGTAGRNILRGPGLVNLDFSLVKDTRMKILGEGGKLEFRAEVFNILNRANFDVPNRTVFAGSATPQAALATAGVITNTTTNARQIQLALRVIF